MRTILLAILMLSLNACTTVIRTPTGFDELGYERAIKSNDVNAVSELLKEKPFLTKVFVIPMSGENRSFDEWQAHRQLELAVIGPGCRPEIVQMLLDAGLRPNYYDITYAGYSLCPE